MAGDSRSRARRRPDAGTRSGPRAGAQPGAQSEARSGAQPGAQSEARSGAQSGAQPGAQSEARSGAQPGAQSGAQSDLQSGSNVGTLYVVATPIGNLADCSPRALAILGAVDRIAAEDTRRTRRLLTAHGLRGRLESCHDHNEGRIAPRLVGRLLAGESVALVTDAGTPGVSDPAYRLVRLALDAGVEVEAVPGPSAVLTALVVAGLPMERFVFEGFLPRRPGQLRRRLAALAELPHTLVLFEAPPRVVRLLTAVHEVLGDRPLAVCRELTKLHEETWRGTVAEWLEERSERPLKGEVTLVIGGATRRLRQAEAADESRGSGMPDAR